MRKWPRRELRDCRPDTHTRLSNAAMVEPSGRLVSLTTHEGSEIVTLAVYLLGDQHAVDTEDAAVKAHHLAPGYFTWPKYSDQINLELVRVNLSNAKKPQNGALLLGSGRTGWSLTKGGLKWARQAALQSVDRDLTRSRAQSRAGSIDENRWRRERSRIQLSPAWKLWVGQNQRAPP
jgi:hypothetical protein